MERFAADQDNDAHRSQLLDAIRGAGAFRSFRGAIRRLGIEDDWFQFRQSALEQVARDWLESKGLSYR